MAGKTYAALSVAADVQDGDLMASFRAAGPLKSILASVFVSYLTGAARTWAAKQSISVNTAATAADYFALVPTDAGVGKPSFILAKEASALLWKLRLDDGTTVAGQLDVALTLLNLTGALTVSGLVTAGALTVSGSALLSGGITQTGSSKFSVTALAALNVDFSVNDVQTKAIAVNSAFTFSGLTAGKAQSVSLFLTISGAAIPTWPAGTKFSNGVDSTASLGNGNHELRLATPDGATVIVSVANRAYA